MKGMDAAVPWTQRPRPQDDDRRISSQTAYLNRPPDRIKLNWLLCNYRAFGFVALTCLLGFSKNLRGICQSGTPRWAI